jgi:hypothetical protein
MQILNVEYIRSADQLPRSFFAEPMREGDDCTPLASFEIVVMKQRNEACKSPRVSKSQGSYQFADQSGVDEIK